MDELPRAQAEAGVGCQVLGFTLKPDTSYLTSAIDRQTKVT